MNKAQLLTDLSTRDYIKWVGTPVAGANTDEGSEYYTVKTRQINGNAASYINVEFYVVSGGTGNEAAFYKDIPPAQRSKNLAFYDWMRDQIDINPNNYKGIQVLWVSERWEMVIYNILVTGGGFATQKTYYVRKGQGAAIEISGFNPALMGSIFSL